MSARIGKLELQLALEHPELLADPVLRALRAAADEDARFAGVGVAAIDPDLADTAAFCAAYDVPMEVSANCVVVAGKRDGERRIAACLVLATTRVDVNGVVKRRLDVRKASFLSTVEAVELTGMEYGGITPLGLPAIWPILVDPAVARLPWAVIGSGLRRSKLAIPGQAVATFAERTSGGVVALAG